MLDLTSAFLAGRKPTTAAAYLGDLRDFSRWKQGEDLESVIQDLQANGPLAAFCALIDYTAHLRHRNLAPTTIHRRLGTLKSILSMSRRLGTISWRVELPRVQRTPRRDTRGPGLGVLQRINGIINAQVRPFAERNRGLMALLAGMGLRRREVSCLDLDHWDHSRKILAVLGKGFTERHYLSVPTSVADAIEAWIAVRGREPGPLFLNFDRAGKGDGRLSGDGIYRIVRALGDKVSARVRPHGIRHTAITTALDLFNGDVRRVMRFSRHRSIQTLMRYDDDRLQSGLGVAEAVAHAVCVTE